MSSPRAWLAWSCGKDSAWALHELRRQGEVEVVGLLTVVNQAFGRVAMHAVREELLAAQAEAVGLPLCRAGIPFPCDNATYEQAMARSMEEAKRQGITHMAFGDLFLEDVRQYRERQLAPTGIEPLFPLWKRPTAQLADQMIAAGLVAQVTCVDPKKVPRELVGRPFDRELLGLLPPEVDPCAENGEFHTCVAGGPMFRRPIPVRVGETVERDGFVFADLMLAQASAAEKRGAAQAARLP